MKKYVSLCQKMNQVMVGLGVLLLAFVIALTFVQVLTRNLFSFSFTWAEELSRYVVIYAVYLASGSIFYFDQNARVDMFFNLFPKKVQGILNCVFYLLIATFLVIMGYYGYVYVVRNLKIWCTSIRIPWAFPFASLVLGSVNMLMQIPAKLYETYTHMIVNKTEGEM